jgi:hypothetical protein
MRAGSDRHAGSMSVPGGAGLARLGDSQTLG